ncbi:phosphonate degradation HD-domain oxygenase [Thalassoglobus polymorphus]|uniref:HD domain protein n=1 Tax=Thalassoglobus polymorphus TaxID=2527994 RepID=A0A517QLG4_9PLAN|nr:phosphonate degradation HD-domain oxygenase [Thalassoglobus polymorphus]QDT32449.1 HD domain protein [Thalassoglobus polymorphus]
MATPTTHKLLELFEKHGNSQYGGEDVTQLDHALQAATLAEKEGASPELIVAALLHDVGHLLHNLPENAPDQGIDDHHESLGYRFACQLFPESVTEPIRMHVVAKRYLCAVEPDYFSTLSQPSVVSLELQGGPMNEREVSEFERKPFAHDAVRLRRWDDTAKDPALKTPPLSHFEKYLSEVALKGSEE